MHSSSPRPAACAALLLAANSMLAGCTTGHAFSIAMARPAPTAETLLVVGDDAGSLADGAPAATALQAISTTSGTTSATTSGLVTTAAAQASAAGVSQKTGTTPLPSIGVSSSTPVSAPISTTVSTPVVGATASTSAAPASGATVQVGVGPLATGQATLTASIMAQPATAQVSATVATAPATASVAASISPGTASVAVSTAVSTSVIQAVLKTSKRGAAVTTASLLGSTLRVNTALDTPGAEISLTAPSPGSASLKGAVTSILGKPSARKRRG